MRLFIAVNFDGPTKENIIAVQNRLRQLGRGNFSRPENLHLTLAFMGEVEPDQEITVCRLMDELAVPVLQLAFDQVGCFKREGGDIWWLGLAANKALLDLQKDLSSRLRKAGFAIENRRFSPHITLARKVLLNRKPDLSKLLGTPFATEAHTVSLMLSERINGRLTYTERYSAMKK